LGDVAATSSGQAGAPAPSGVSFAYACSFLWGFLWRSFLTTLPLAFIAPMAFVAILPFELLGDPTALMEPQHLASWFGKFVLIGTLLSLAGLLLMAVAMRWTLADFRRRDAAGR